MNLLEITGIILLAVVVFLVSLGMLVIYFSGTTSEREERIEKMLKEEKSK